MLVRSLLSINRSAQRMKFLSQNSSVSLIYTRHNVEYQYLPKTSALIRFYSDQEPIDKMTVNYDYVQKATANKTILIIDVREPDELKEHGKIPNSINIPLGDVSAVLSTMPSEQFESHFKRPKPEEDTEIIFYCMIGKRSGMAQQNALNLGYKKVKNYLGSWTEWAGKKQ